MDKNEPKWTEIDKKGSTWAQKIKMDQNNLSLNLSVNLFIDFHSLRAKLHFSLVCNLTHLDQSF